MIVDAFAVLVVLVFALFGYQRGFVFQIVKLFGIALAFFGCYRAGRAAAKIFPAWDGVAPVVRVYGLTILSFFFIILTMNLIGILAREMIYHGREPEHRKRDRVRGLALGILDGAFWAVMFLFGVAAIPKGFLRGAPAVERQVSGSLFVAITRPLNFLADPDILVTDSRREVEALARILDFIADGGREEALRKAGYSDPLWDDLRLKNLATDPDARKILATGERRKAMLHPLLADVLTDRTLMDLILQFEPPSLPAASASANPTATPAALPAKGATP